MKIQVIDNIGQIQPLLLMAEADVDFYSDEIQALNAAEQHRPSLILLNFALRGSETPDYTSMLLAASPTSNIVVIGDSLRDEQIVQCILAGAKGYQNSGSLTTYINRMIGAVSAGEAWLSRKLVAYLLDSIHKHNLVQLA